MRLLKRFLSTVVAVLLVSSPSWCDEHLVLGSFPGPVSELSGLVLTEAYDRLGIRIEIIELPLERSLVESNKGAIDGEVNRAPVIEGQYGNLVRVPSPVNHIEVVVFTKDLDMAVTGWESLRPYRIAIRKGVKMVEARTRGMRVTPFLSTEKMLLLVWKERYDLCVASRLNGWWQIQRSGYTSLKVLEPPLETLPLYHYLHRRHAGLVPRITAAIEQFKSDGGYERIKAAFWEKLSDQVVQP